MRKITKKTIKRIKDGFHDDLIESIEFLIDTYNEDKFDAGYKSCMEDMSVRSYRLAEYIVEHTTLGGKKTGKFDFDQGAKEILAKVIEEYFTNALNNK